MNMEYPPKGCDISRLVMNPGLVAAVLAGKKTQQRRNDLYAYPGETFVLEGVTFVVTAVFRQQLKDMTDKDAEAEGFADSAAYKNFIMQMHRSVTLNEDASVWVHVFERQR